MQSQKAPSQEAHTSNEEPQDEAPTPMPGMPEWMKKDFLKGCAQLRGQAAKDAVLMDEVQVHGESRMAMAIGQ